MKQELLEYIIRECAREVIAQIKEDETIGAAAPPADGQGTADQPAIPKDKDTNPEPPQDKETPEVPSSPDLKGTNFVNPRDKSRLQKVELKGGDDASLERTLHRLASSVAGARVKVALATLRAAKEAARNPSSTLFLYIGKYDPESDEIFLMADKSLQVAKDSSIPPSEISSGVSTIPPDMSNQFDPNTASTADYIKRMSSAGQTIPEPVAENLLKSVREIVNEILDEK